MHNYTNSTPYFCYDKFFNFFVILKIYGHSRLLVCAEPHSSAPAVASIPYKVHLVACEGGHGDALDPVGRVDTTQHTATFGANKTANSHVDIGRPPLLTVKALLVLQALRLDLPDGQADPVVLLT